uniref:Protein transport protein SFT2 isoform X1 n=1 Tax=Rhizophora mucronata TaxID=61149 RepID=A0A2P2MDK3_RHIMU
MINPQPSVKQIANFWGIRTMTGRNMANAMKMKNTPVARNKPKYTSAFPEGMLLVADCKFPGISLTPLETTLKVPVTVSFAERTAASRSNPMSNLARSSSSSLEAAYEFQSASSDDAGFCC